MKDIKMKFFKIVIDSLLLAITVLLENNDITGRLNHEILGIIMAVLLVVHIIINWKWIKNITKNFKKVNKKTKMMYIVNWLTMVIYFGAIILGILISSEIFKFKTMSNSTLVLAHIIFGKLAIIVMFLHIGINLDVIFLKVKNKMIKKLIKILYTIIAIIISVISVYKLTHSFQWMSYFSQKRFESKIQNVNLKNETTSNMEDDNKNIKTVY